MSNRVYLDWNATTPLRPEAKVAMADSWDVIGNPSSIHNEGRAARQIVEKSRAVLAKSIGADSRQVIFTSGGTEANALALTPGLARRGERPAERLIVSAIEHPSVLAGGRFDQRDIAIAPVTAQGVVDLDAVAALLADHRPALVSVMLANNETGAIQPVAAVADLVHRAGGLLHVDAIQALGKVPVELAALRADLLTVSGHKFGGPKGVGALIVAGDVAGLSGLIRGGGQELGRRSGTENVAGIAGFGAALRAAIDAMPAEACRIVALRDRLERGLRESSHAVVFSDTVPRLPNTILVAARGLKAETAVIAFDLAGIAVSSGSACSSGKVTPSHVLTAMNVAPDLIVGAIRISLGWETTEADVDRCVQAWRKLSGVLPKASAIGLEPF